MRRLLKGATLSAERLRELLHYDPETGTFTWLRTVSRTEAGNTLRVTSMPARATV